MLVRLTQAPGAQRLDGAHDRAGHISDLFLHRAVFVQRLMAVVIRFVIADVAVELGGSARVNQAHPFQPVAQVAPVVFNACHITMHNHAECAACQVLGEIPTLRFDLFGLSHFLAMGGGGVGVATISTYEAVDHELERAGRLVPVGRCQQDHGMRSYPALIDFCHPVMRLCQRVVRVTAAGPVAQRHGA